MVRIPWLVVAAVSTLAYGQAQTRDLAIRKLPPGSTTEFDKHVKVALITGVANYPQGSGLGSLKYSVRDAQTLASALKNQGYLVRLLLDEQATRSMVRHSIREMTDALEPDQGTFLFFFGGHGFEFKGKNYLATYGVTADDLEGDGLSIADVESLLAESKAKRKLLFIDACRNDPGPGARGVEQRSFAKLTAAEGMKILFSTKEGRVSYEDDKLQEGIFTYFLVKALNGEAAGPDGLVTFRDLADYVSDKMRAYTVERGQVQVPFEAGESSGDFLLAKVGSTPPASIAPTAASPISGTIATNPKDGLHYAYIPAGTFQMGCSNGDTECYDQERPSHPATIAAGFWLGQLETTVGAYKAFAKSTGRAMPVEPRIVTNDWNPGWKIDNLPMSNVTWTDAAAYCQWAGLRLPTEAEWEFAARGGTDAPRYGTPDEIGWYGNNSGSRAIDASAIMKATPKQYLRKLGENGASPKPGGLKKPNGYQLFDMLGNVREWTADLWTASTSESAPDETENAGGKQRVTKGGSYAMEAIHLRASGRGHTGEGGSNPALGFRCAGNSSALTK
jgi:formylglycine-generating enzyme required for sulfatase activity